jgi:WD40 repeat protein
MEANYPHHTEKVRSLAFSPDGAFVLSGSIDGQAKRWPTPQCIYDYLKNEATIPQLTTEQRKLYGID